MSPLLIILSIFGSFIGATSIDYDLQGNLYVVDSERDILVKLSSMGDSLNAVGGTGSGSLQFDDPVAVYARRGMDIYVADYNNHRVQRFNRTLDFISTIYTRDDDDERNRFGYPRDIAVTRQGDVLIVDGENRRIVKITSAGRMERTFGDISDGAGRLIDPSDVEVDERDNVYVLDEGRIVAYDPFGSYLRQIDLPLAAETRVISVDNDTLTAADSTTLVMYDLTTRSMTGIHDIARPLVAVRRRGGVLITLEPKQGIFFGEAPDEPIELPRPDTLPAGVDE